MPFIGAIKIIAGSIFPNGWVICDGSLTNVDGNEILAGLLLNLGVDPGATVFKLPDCLGRTLVHGGMGGGVENVLLNTSNLPLHNHLSGTHATANSTDPTGAVLAGAGTPTAFAIAPANAAFDSSMLGSVGDSLPHSNIQPFLALNILVCKSGIAPA